MRFEFLMTVTMKTMDSYEVTLCSFTAGHQNFGGICHLLSSGKIYSKDGDSRFLQQSNKVPNYQVSYPRRQRPSNVETNHYQQPVIFIH